MIKGEQEQKKIDKYWERKCAEELRQRTEKRRRELQQSAHRSRLALDTIAMQTCVDPAVRMPTVDLVVDAHERKSGVRRAQMDRLRDERINYHKQEIDKLNEVKERQMADRLNEKCDCRRNEEINRLYDVACRLHKMSKTRRLQNAIRSQIEHRRRSELADRAQNVQETNRFIAERDREEDETFLNLANQMITIAKSRDNPLFPIVKAVNEYKSQHRLFPPKDYLPHLKSNVDVKQLGA